MPQKTKLAFAILALSGCGELNVRSDGLAIETVTCRSEKFYLFGDMSGGQSTLINCSRISTESASEIISKTDAAALTRNGHDLMTRSDVYAINNEWVMWIDTNKSPGIIRGLWAIDINGAPHSSWIDPNIPGMPLKSTIEINKGFFGEEKAGYEGLHVEIWRTPEGDGFFYTYPDRDPENIDTSVKSEGASISFRTTLIADSDEYVDPAPEALPPGRSRLRFRITYDLSPDAFGIQTALGATENTHVAGHAGGLLLLLNRSCPRHFTCTDLDGLLRERSLHVITTTPGFKVDKKNDYDKEKKLEIPSKVVSYEDNVFDMFAPGKEDFRFNSLSDYEDRAMGSFDSDTIWMFGTSRLGPSLLTIQPQWEGGNNEWGKLIAYHYNDRRLGKVGFNSLDVVITPKAKPLSIGPDNELRWRAWLSHREKGTVSTDQSEVHGVALGARSALVVWGKPLSAPRANGYTHDAIAARLVAFDGSLGPEVRLSTPPPESMPSLGDREASVAYSSLSDAFQVSFYRYYAVDGKYSIRTRRISGVTGLPVSEELELAKTTDFQLTTKTAYDPDTNSFLIAWASGTDTINTSGKALSVARLSGDGTSVLSQATLIAEQAKYPSLAYDPDRKRFLATWTRTRPLPTANYLEAQFIDISGAPLGPVFTIRPLKGDAMFSDVDYDKTTSTFLVVFWERSEGHFWDVLAVPVDAATGQLRSEPKVISAGPHRYRPRVAFLPARRRFITSYGHDTGEFFDNLNDVKAQWLDSGGNLEGKPLLLHQYRAFWRTEIAAHPTLDLVGVAWSGKPGIVFSLLKP